MGATAHIALASGTPGTVSSNGSAIKERLPLNAACTNVPRLRDLMPMRGPANQPKAATIKVAPAIAINSPPKPEPDPPASTNV